MKSFHWAKIYLQKVWYFLLKIVRWSSLAFSFFLNLCYKFSRSVFNLVHELRRTIRGITWVNREAAVIIFVEAVILFSVTGVFLFLVELLIYRLLTLLI